MATVAGQKVVRLDDFRKKKGSSDPDIAPERDETKARSILDEVSYHLVMAARAIAAQTTKH